ncbi:MAG: sodium:solute symporter [Saprospiraceae bacterium]|nr:sodium:solute symporter [Saprospiraceae bacterium]
MFLLSYTAATSLLIGCYIIVTLFLVIRGARKTKTISDYALGSGFSPIVVGLSLAASITSAATFIINPGFVAMFGFSAFVAMALVLPLGLYISLIVLSKSFRKYGSSIKALTLAQWVGTRYNSPGYGKLMAVLSLLLITFIVLICVGLTKVLAGALNTDELYVLISLVVFVFGYTMFGGANTMIYTNTIQAVLMIIVAIIILSSGYDYFETGISEFISSLEAKDPLLTKFFNPSSPLFRDWFEVIFCNFIIGIAIVCQPHIITRSLMLRSEKDMNKYLTVAIVTEILFFFVMFAGLYARLEFGDLTLNGSQLKLDGILSAYVIQKFSVGLGIIVIMGLMAAGLSTLEGIVQSVSTTVTNDIITPLLNSKNNTEQNKSRINKAVIVILGVVSIYVSYQQLINPNLSVGILAQNGVYAFFSAAFIPVLFGIFLKDVHKSAPMAATITAVIVHFSVYYGSLSFYTTGPVKNPAVAATYGILSALAVGLSLYYWHKLKKESQTEIRLQNHKTV